MFIISKTIIGKEYIYSTKFSILCKDKKQADKLATFLNKNNDNSIGDFKLKENEKWYTYEIDNYDIPPRYVLSTTRGKITLKEYIG